ncbi:long-chain fatty acid transporter fat1 [Rhizina undulata]
MQISPSFKHNYNFHRFDALITIICLNGNPTYGPSSSSAHPPRTPLISIPTVSLLLKSALPAAVLASYLDAKHSISNDFGTINAFLISRLRLVLQERKDQLNPFFILEALAKSSKAAARNHSFLVYEGKAYSYAQAYELALKYATWLEELHGVKKGDIVALDFTNKPSYIWFWFGLWALGARPALLNYNLRGERLVHCIVASTAELLIVDSEVAEAIADEEARKAIEDGGKRKIVLFDEPMQQAVETWKMVRPDDSVRRGIIAPDMAMLIYTSGTTGLPKPAVVSYQKVHHGTGFVKGWLKLGPNDILYTCMPIYHTSAALLAVLSSLASGSTVVLGHKFSNRTFWKEVRESKANIIQYVGETCRYLLSAPPSEDDKNHNVKTAFGNGLRPDIWMQFKDRFGIENIAEFYASTEGTSGSWNYQSGSYAAGAIGRTGPLLRMLFSINVKIVKVDTETELPWRDPKTGFCVECKSDEAGEVLWRVNETDVTKSFQGYFGNNKATEEKILRNVLKKGDAFFRTGDLQKVTPEGLWYFLDRLGDTFRWKSENVSTTEVGEVLSQHPLIAANTVFGIQLPHHDGRCGMAALVLKSEAFVDPEKLDVRKDVLDELARWMKKRLPKFAVPVFLRITRDLELTGNMKVVKKGFVDEGIDLDKVTVGDKVYWLGTEGGNDGGYREWNGEHWGEMKGGRVKL